jgi:alpha-glucoside transport system substrate-binding protein
MKLKFFMAALLAGATLGVVAAQAQELKYPKGEGAFSWDALQAFADAHKDLAGQTLTIWGPWREGGDQEQFLTVLAYFEEATGVDVQYGSSENYEQQAQIDAAAGSSANITILPQPGLLADMASKVTWCRSAMT